MKAVSLTESLLKKHKENIEALNLLSSSGGVFEVNVDDDLVFSKKALGRFPEEGEIEKIVSEKISG